MWSQNAGGNTDIPTDCKIYSSETSSYPHTWKLWYTRFWRIWWVTFQSKERKKIEFPKNVLLIGEYKTRTRHLSEIKYQISDGYMYCATALAKKHSTSAYGTTYVPPNSMNCIYKEWQILMIEQWTLISYSQNIWLPTLPGVLGGEKRERERKAVTFIRCWDASLEAVCTNMRISFYLMGDDESLLVSEWKNKSGPVALERLITVKLSSAELIFFPQRNYLIFQWKSPVCIRRQFSLVNMISLCVVGGKALVQGVFWCFCPFFLQLLFQLWQSHVGILLF